MKMLVIVVLVLFVGFWMVQAPSSLAQFASEGAGWSWAMTETVFSSVIDFLGALFD
jgi:hypothetical protein